MKMLPEKQLEEWSLVSIQIFKIRQGGLFIILPEGNMNANNPQPPCFFY